VKSLRAIAFIALALSAASCMRGDLTVLAIQNATLFDGTPKPPVSPAHIIVRRGRIVAFGPAGKVEIPSGADVVDGAGRYVLPTDLREPLRVGADANLLLVSVNPAANPKFLKHVTGKMEIGRWTQRPER